jgi:hypothetical protein
MKTDKKILWKSHRIRLSNIGGGGKRKTMQIFSSYGLEWKTWRNLKLQLKEKCEEFSGAIVRAQ